MNESNASLETSQQTQADNSASVDNQSVQQPRAPRTDKQQTTGETRKPKSLAELFGDTNDESSTEMVLDEPDVDDPDKPVDSIDRLMKRNGLTAEQAYAIKVPMPNGAEPLTIGELKDRIAELSDFELRETEFDQRRIKQEGELMRAQADIRGLLELLPKEAIKPEVLNKLRAQQNATLTNERRLTAVNIPEWQDDIRRTREMAGMQEMLADYGFPPSFLENEVVDHRAIKFLRDSFLIRERIQKALKDVRDPQKKNMRPSGKSGKAPARPGVSQTNRRTGSTPTQRDRIMGYLNSQE